MKMYLLASLLLSGCVAGRDIEVCTTGPNATCKSVSDIPKDDTYMCFVNATAMSCQKFRISK